MAFMTLLDLKGVSGFWSCVVGYLPSHSPEARTSGTASAVNPNWATSVMPS